MQSRKNGYLLAVESIDRGGKTSAIKLLRPKLEEKYGDLIVWTREPGGTSVGGEIRKFILDKQYADKMDEKARMLLFWADRIIHMNEVIIPAIIAGKIVITDRFDASTYAYQIYPSGNKDWDEHFWVSRKLILGDFKPDLYILFDIQSKTSILRGQNQGLDVNHYDKSKYEEIEKRRDGLWKFTNYVPHEVIDAEQKQEKVIEEFEKFIELYVRKVIGEPGF